MCGPNINHTITRRITEDIDTGVADASGENPDVCEDDIVHDIAMSICQAEWAQGNTAEVNWIWRGMFGSFFPKEFRV